MLWVFISVIVFGHDPVCTFYIDYARIDHANVKLAYAVNATWHNAPGTPFNVLYKNSINIYKIVEVIWYLFARFYFIELCNLAFVGKCYKFIAECKRDERERIMI